MAAGFVPRNPPYISTAELADLVNRDARKNVWDTQDARRWIKRHGIAIKLGSRWVTTREQLREEFPDMAYRILLFDDD